MISFIQIKINGPIVQKANINRHQVLNVQLDVGKYQSIVETSINQYFFEKFFRLALTHWWFIFRIQIDYFIDVLFNNQLEEWLLLNILCSSNQNRSKVAAVTKCYNSALKEYI